MGRLNVTRKVQQIMAATLARYIAVAMLVLVGAGPALAQPELLPTAIRAVRFDASGARDYSFGSGVLATADVWLGDAAALSGGGYEVNHATLDNVGRIIIVGSYKAKSQAKRLLAVWRLTKSGLLDTTFGNNGRALREFASDVHGNRAIVKSNGAILVVGSSDGGFARACFSDTGTKCYWTYEGVTQFPGYNAAAHAIALTADGGFVVGGRALRHLSSGWDLRLALAKFVSNGQIDAQFSAGGIKLHNISPNFSSPASFDEAILGLAVAPDDRIVAVGNDGRGRLFAARYNRDGSRDASFGTSGTGVVRPPVGCGTGGGCVLDTGANQVFVSGSTITAAGWAGTSTLLVLRLNMDGSFDTSFHGNGWRMESPGTGVLGAAGLSFSGDLFVSASLYPVTEPRFAGVYRYDSSGARILSFGDSGVAFAPSCYQYPVAVGSAVQWFPIFAGSPPDLRPVLVYACYEWFW